MKVIVTGGAGFIGSNLCEELCRNSNEVLCVDNFDDFYSPKIKEENVAGFLHFGNFKIKKCDIKNGKSLVKIFGKFRPDAIVHLAARPGVRPSIEDPEPYLQNNIIGTLNVLDACKKSNVKKIVAASSSSVYGANAKLPFSESDPVDRQLSPYAFTKRALELLCSTYHDLYGIDVACLRFFTVYGPRNRPDMAISKFTRLIDAGEGITLYGNGKRDYTYVGDIVGGIIAALNRADGFEIINLGGSNPVELRHLVSLIESALGKPADISFAEGRQGEMEETYADIKKAKRILGWKPRVSINEGISKFVNWYLEKGA